MNFLILSHNVFSKTSSMGKTLSAYFKGFENEKISQFYIHSEIPTDDSVCKDYYRVTDKEIIKSIFSRKSGKVFNEKDIVKSASESRTDIGLTAAIYQKSRSRTPLIYLARNFLWRIGKWNTKKLNEWIDTVNPDAIFLASGDYSFIYRIALKIAKKRNIPLFLSCMDDYYFYNKNENSLLGRFQHKLFMRQVKMTIGYSSAIFSICDKMTVDYGKFFNKLCYTLHTGSTITEPLNFDKTNKISYVGNMGYKRNEQLIALGKALREIDKDMCIDVYSAESRTEILKHMTHENGINFCGAIDAETVKKVIGESMLVIHTESFDSVTRKIVRYSVSTKIADSLASGTCLLAYGPEEIASISYLKNNDAAFVITENDDLVLKLREIITNEALRQKITENALKLAKSNHNININSKKLLDIIKENS